MSRRKPLRMVLVALATVGTVLLGWGIRDAAGFFHSFPRGVFLASLVVWLTSAAGMIDKATKKGTRTPSGQRLLLVLVQVIDVALLVFLPYADRHGLLVMRPEWVRWVGLIVALAGNGVTLIAARTLGANYSAYVTIQERHRLIQSGIYGVIRHPIYLGILLSWPGACLVFRSWLAFPVSLFYLVFAVLRGRQE